ncbi:condensin complex subunit 3-like isoform X1 [Rhynchophorus ferrugineus]|uniref:condensin complex subunit 3-like isoform X1 n=1 Tax=Rhynchophorus ferrugineus TaxID=354439 RepID=UPI003FCECC84
MKQKLIEILNIVQESPINHQKYIRYLKILYNDTKFEDFLDNILYYLQGVLQKDHTNSSVKHILDFLAKFIAQLNNTESERNEESAIGEYVHILLSNVIEVVLKYHQIENHNCRYNACSFISTLLTNIGETQLDDGLCDLIETAMIENTKDPKPVVRLQALLALFRLQDPLNPDCPVIQAFLTCLKDSSHIVRREAAKRIAPNALTLPKLKDRIRDVNENVRYAAFVHCGDLGLTHFRIIQRQHILRSGFNENNRIVKKVFLTHLIPKWLSSVNGEYMTFFNAIRLDSDETDISDTRELTKNLIELFGKTEPINGLIDALPLSDEKLIPVNKVDCDLIHYWDILTSYLRKTEGMDDHLELIIPELAAFCNYIDQVVTDKTKTNMNEIQYMDFENMLFYLLDMADNFDFSDEVGRKALKVLTKKLLCNHWLQKPLLVKIVQINRKLYINVIDFVMEIHQVITDKRNPIIETPRIVDNQKGLQLSKLKVELLCLKSDLENAVSDSDFQKAAILQEKIAATSTKLESLQAPGQMDIIRCKETKTDQNTVCWCLDLLTATLAYGDLKGVSSFLIALREEFVKPLLNNKDMEIQWRTFKCIATYCIYDEQFAKEQIKLILSPIISYRLMPNYSKDMVVTAVYTISDLLRIHGPKLFDFDVEYRNSQNSTRRRLYTQDDEDTNDVTNEVSLEILLNIILDMLDDEIDELRDAALMAYSKLILNGFYVTPTVITRLILKWYNPATGTSEEALQKKQANNMKLEVILQQKIGTVISVFPERIKEARGIIAKAIIPVISNIANAPRTSPLVDVDPDNVLKFLATVIQDSSDSSDLIQRELVHELIKEISTNPTAAPTPYFAKLLLYLNLDLSDAVLVNELIAQIELLKNMETLDKISKQRLQKYIDKLQGISSRNISALTHVTTDSRESCTVNDNTTDGTAMSTQQTQEIPVDGEETGKDLNGTNCQDNINTPNQSRAPNQKHMRIVLVDCITKKTTANTSTTATNENNDSTSDQSVHLTPINKLPESVTETQRGKQKRRLESSNNIDQENSLDYDSDNLRSTNNTDIFSQTKLHTPREKKKKRKHTKNVDKDSESSNFETNFESTDSSNSSDINDKNQKSTQLIQSPADIEKPKSKRVEELKLDLVLRKKVLVDKITRKSSSSSDESNRHHTLGKQNSKDFSRQKTGESPHSFTVQAINNSQTLNRRTSERIQGQVKTSGSELNKKDPKTNGKNLRTPTNKVDLKTNSNEVRRSSRAIRHKQKYSNYFNGLKAIINKTSDQIDIDLKTKQAENLKANKLTVSKDKNSTTSSDNLILSRTRTAKLKGNCESEITTKKNNVGNTYKTNTPHKEENNSQRPTKTKSKLLEQQNGHSKTSRRRPREVNSQASSDNSSSGSPASKSGKKKKVSHHDLTNSPQELQTKISKVQQVESSAQQSPISSVNTQVITKKGRRKKSRSLNQESVGVMGSSDSKSHQLVTLLDMNESSSSENNNSNTNLNEAVPTMVQLRERLARHLTNSSVKTGDRHPQVKRKKGRPKKSANWIDESVGVRSTSNSRSDQSKNLLNRRGSHNNLAGHRSQITVLQSDSESPVRVRKAPRKK